MKLFKNGVGRPSNEVKEARRVFIVSIIAIVISVIALLVSLLTKSELLTEKLNGAASYKITYGLSNTNNNDISKISYPSINTHAGRVNFNVRPSYTVKNGKTCSFKGWIIQRTSDGRYRVKNKNTNKNAWYSSSKDSKINWEYNYLSSGTLSVNSNVKLYAAFDCKSTSSNTTTKKASTSISMPKYYSGDSKGSSLLIGKSYGKFSVSTSKSGSTINVKSSNPDLVKVIKHAANSWELKVTSDYKNRGESVKITATTSDGASLTHEYFLRGNYEIRYETNAQTYDYRYDVHKFEIFDGDVDLWKNEFVRVGYNFKGWYAYRVINGTKKYFQYSISNKGWNCSSTSCAKKFSDKANISIMKKYTGAGADIYMEAVWAQKSSKEYLVNFCEEFGECDVMPSQIIDVNDKINANKLKNGKKKFDGWYPYRIVNGKANYLKYDAKNKTCKWQTSKSAVIPDKAKLGTYVNKCTGTGTEIYLEAKWK